MIAGACLCWAIDNNMTRNISAANPLQISMLKNFIAGLTNTTLAIGYGVLIPNILMIFLASIIGFIGYGLSLLLFILGLRHIGIARTSAYFSIAPFVGAGLSIIFFSETISLQFLVATFLMGIGIWLHLSEQHSHEHLHDEIEHEHQHVHDIHHQHEHLSTDPIGEPHTHLHKHEALLPYASALS
jgi:drug/metabolite transporter (DMT)-like permease